MKIARIGAAVFAGASIAALTLTASPAFADSARTLTTGSAMYAIDCEADANQLYSLDTPTGKATAVGASSDLSAGWCAGPAAVDPVSGVAYYIQWADETQLRSMNLATGASAQVGEFKIGGINVSPDSLTIGLDGRAYAIVEDPDGYDTSDSALYSLDLASGALTYVGDTGTFDEEYYGLSVDPNTGTFLVISTEGKVASIDVTTGVQTSLGTVSLVYPGSGTESTEIYSMSIDRSGIAWVENYGPDYSDLWSIDFSDLTAPQFASSIATDPSDVAGTNFDTESIFIVPAAAPVVTAPVVVTPQAVTPVAKPALAETGVSDAELTGMGFAAAASILLGAATLLVPRMRRKARA